MPPSVQTYLCTRTVLVMPLFYRMVLIHSSSLSDEMLCSMYELFYPFPKDNNSTVHPTVTRVITKKTDPSHKPRLDGNVRILRGAIFLQPPQMLHRIFWSSVIDVRGSAGLRIAPLGLSSCTSRQKLHLFRSFISM